ncbi:MAG TPA: sn-glycerol-3-phosphate ABC transporter ATP-binding protein UgpC, partial [Thermoanaerobaculia bacterium]|nr:sn-glycerol-3-phosphate ABC transporter ATP-binding protein UgpC [Thermoanaerobaculia bacterium]
MAEVRLEKVEKRFGDVLVIAGLDLEVRDHEFMVLVGPSGCGKSTVLRMIAGLESVTAGRIFIGDRLVNDVAPKDRDIAMVFQNYALYPHMTVRANMEFGLRMRKTPAAEIERMVGEAAATLGIAPLLDRKPRQLSGGQRQRVALGRAIVRQPAVFLFDEPLSNLDAKLRVQMRAEISKLQQRLRTTAVYVTHDQVEAMTMGHRIAVMKDGRIQQVGTPYEVYEKPSNLFVANFIGTPPMNFIPATIAAGGTTLTASGMSIPVPAS